MDQQLADYIAASLMIHGYTVKLRDEGYGVYSLEVYEGDIHKFTITGAE